MKEELKSKLLKNKNSPFYLSFNCKSRVAKFSPNITVSETNDKKIKDFYLSYENEFHRIAAQKKDNVLLFSIHRNKIPMYIKYNNRTLEISSSPHILYNNNPVNIDSILNVLAEALYDTGCVFEGIESLLPSSIYEYNFSRNLLKYKGLQLYPVRSTRYELLEKIIYRFKSLLKNGQNIYVMISAGYDSRLDLALARYAAREFGNKIVLLHLYTDDPSKRIVNKIAEYYGYDIKTFDSSYLIDNFDYEKVWPFVSGYFPIGVYLYFPMVDIIKKLDPNSIVIGYGFPTLKGRYYYKKDYDWLFDVYSLKKELLMLITDAAGYSQNKANELIEQNREFIKNAIKISEVYEDIYQKFDVLNMLIRSSSYGKRAYPFIGHFSMAFCIDDNSIANDFISLPAKHKINANFILYTLLKLDKNLLKFPFITGNYEQFTFPVVCKLCKSIQKKFKKESPVSKKIPSDYESAYLDLIADINNPSCLSSRYLPEGLCRYMLGEESVKWKTKLIFTEYLDYLHHVSVLYHT
jgi:hypothetical protein